jgi:transcriptional regulator with XRE-family HTH domain
MRRWLGAELVRLRTDAGLTQRDAAAALRCSVGKVSYLESGERAIRPDDLVTVLFDLYGVPPEQHPQLLEAARTARQRGWWDHWSDEDLARGERWYIGLEDGAVLLRAFLPSIVHGLLQTPDYTKGILRSSKTIPEERITRLLELRQTRQSLLSRTNDPLDVHLILDEAAVTRQVCSAESMKEQLLHIAITAEELSNVTVQILPFSSGSHGAYFGPFSILDFPWEDDSGLVFVEGLVEARYLTSRADVYKHAALFERLTALALTPEESIRSLRSRAAEGA